jgi:hypothetical protein
MRPQKITFGEMRFGGTIGILVSCTDYRCSHSMAMAAEGWPDDVRLSDIEPRFVCKACGKRGADAGRISRLRKWNVGMRVKFEGRPVRMSTSELKLR